MALIAKYLIDTSAAARMHLPEVKVQLAPVIANGLAATTAVLDAEALYSARNAVEYERRWADRRVAYEYLAIDDEHWQATLEAQRDLAAGGRHRSVGIADLLTAVLAAQHRLTVLHCDRDFETAATVLNFQHRWIVLRGAE